MTKPKMWAILILHYVSYGVFALMIYAGFRASDWYAPLVFLASHIVFTNLAGARVYIHSLMSRTPSSSETELARFLRKELLQTRKPVLFLLSPRYRASRIQEWVRQHLPSRVRDGYSVSTLPIVWNLVLMVLSRGYRMAIVQKSSSLNRVTGLPLELSALAGLTLAITGPADITSTFWSGIWGSGLPWWGHLGVTIAVVGVSAALYYVLGYRFGSVTLSPGEMVYASSLGPAHEEIMFGWIYTIFFTIAIMATGVAWVPAVIIGSLLATPYFVLAHSLQYKSQTAVFAIIRLILNGVLIALGYWPAFISHALINLYISIGEIVTQRRQQAGSASQG
jgi:hypothetical protein